MTATLPDVAAEKKQAQSAEQQAAAELVRRAREQGLSLIGPDGLLKQLTKSVIETALNEEMTKHLGYEKQDPPGAGTGNIRNGSRSKTVLTEHTGAVQSSIWAEVMPEWCRERRDEIVARLREHSDHELKEDVHGCYRNHPGSRLVTR